MVMKGFQGHARQSRWHVGAEGKKPVLGVLQCIKAGSGKSLVNKDSGEEIV
jgi:hypothetical protein